MYFEDGAEDPDQEMAGGDKGLVDDSGKYGQPKQFDPEFHGPIKKRSCTDVICLALFLIFLAGWAVVAYFAIANGNWNRLIYPTNSQGQICGTKTNSYEQTNRTKLVYFDVSKCSSTQLVTNKGCPTHSECVFACPNYYWHLGSPNAWTSNDAYEQNAICLNGRTFSTMNNDDRRMYCAPFIMPSRSILGRCFPNLSNINMTAFNENFGTPSSEDYVSPQALIIGTQNLTQFLGAGATIDKVFQDFSASWVMILIGFVLAMIISFIWIVLMRWIAAPMIWLGLLAVLALLTYSTYFCFTTWQQLCNQKPTQFDNDDILRRQEAWLAFGIISAVVLGIILLIAIFLRNRIRLAIGLLREGSKGVSNMMFTLTFPFFPYIFHLAVIGVWGILAILLSSAGEQQGVLDLPITAKNVNKTTCAKENNTNLECIFSEYVRNNNMFTYFQVYNVFMLFWAGFFVMGVGEMSLAGAFASYYWARNKSTDIPTLPLASSVGRTFRYHLGSIAFGSLIIAIVRFIRWLLENLDQKLKRSNLGFARFLVKCCMCCLWCLEKFLKFINKNAYIMIAIYGKNFCRSARSAYSLLMRNILRVVVLDKVTDFLLFLGKLVIVGGMGASSFFFFSGRIPGLERVPPKLNYYFVPIITVIIGSYLIASAFFGVYSMAVDTVFLCFLEDLERNDGSPGKPYFMSKNLMRILGKKNKKVKKGHLQTTST